MFNVCFLVGATVRVRQAGHARQGVRHSAGLEDGTDGCVRCLHFPHARGEEGLRLLHPREIGLVAGGAPREAGAEGRCKSFAHVPCDVIG